MFVQVVIFSVASPEHRLFAAPPGVARSQESPAHAWATGIVETWFSHDTPANRDLARQRGGYLVVGCGYDPRRHQKPIKIVKAPPSGAWTAREALTNPPLCSTPSPGHPTVVRDYNPPTGDGPSGLFPLFAGRATERGDRAMLRGIATLAITPRGPAFVAYDGSIGTQFRGMGKQPTYWPDELGYHLKRPLAFLVSRGLAKRAAIRIVEREFNRRQAPSVDLVRAAFSSIGSR